MLGVRLATKRYFWLFLVALVTLAVLLRAGDLGAFRNTVADEITWLAVGTSLLGTGAPTSWSLFLDVYTASGVDIWASVTPNLPWLLHPFVTPYLSHPPVFSLLIGGWAAFVGQTNLENINWALVRIPMIVISAATLIVTYLFVRRAFGFVMALIVLLAFVFFPSHVVASRLVAAEHFIGLLLMFGLYLMVVRDAAKKARVRRLLGIIIFVLSVLAPLVKLSGIVVPASLGLIAFLQRQYRFGMWLIVAVLLAGLLFATYGYYYNWDLFVNLIYAHQNEAQSFAHFWTLFTKLDIGHYGLFDPSMIVGLIGAIALVAARGLKGGGAYIFAPLLVFSFLFLYVAPAPYFYGWYKYALYPLIAIGLGYVFTQLYKQRVVYLVLFLPLLSIMLENSNILAGQTDRRIMMMVFYALAILPLVFKNRFIQFKPVFISLLIFLFLFEAVWVSRVLGYLTA